MIVKKFRIFNTATQRMLSNTGYETLEEAQSACKAVNGLLMPVNATFMVVKLSDPDQQ